MREITHICWRGHVMTTQAVPPPGTGGCRTKVFSENVNGWLTCGCAVRPILPEEHAAYLMGGEEAVMDLYPGRKLVRWP